MPYCENCGEQISEKAKFCRYCGNEVEPVTSDPERAVSEDKTSQKPGPRKKRKPEPKQTPTPTEEGIPAKKLLTIGGIGSFIGAIGAVIFGLVFTLMQLGDSTSLRLLMMASTIILAMGCVTAGIGFLGFHRKYDQILGIVSFISAMFTAIFWFMLSVIIANARKLGIRGIDAFIIFLILCLLFSGIMLILQGLTVYRTRDSFVNPRITMGQSYVSIIAGLSCASVILVIWFGIGIYLWAVAYFLQMAVFLKDESFPEKEEEDEFDLDLLSEEDLE